MNGLQDRYINPFTDFGFKKLFGEEVNKDLLLDFLNQLLKEEEGEIMSFFSPEERHAYEDSLKYYRDLKNVIDTAWEEGKEEGFEEGLERGREEGLEKGREEGEQMGIKMGKIEIARKLLSQGMSREQVQEMTGLDEEEMKGV